MATPHVAGVVAAYISQSGARDPTRIKQKLLSNAAGGVTKDAKSAKSGFVQFIEHQKPLKKAGVAHVFTGTCESNGFISIHDAKQCREAAEQFKNKFNFIVRSGRMRDERPTGCSWHRFGNVELWESSNGDCEANGYGGCFCKYPENYIKCKAEAATYGEGAAKRADFNRGCEFVLSGVTKDQCVSKCAAAYGHNANQCHCNGTHHKCPCAYCNIFCSKYSDLEGMDKGTPPPSAGTKCFIYYDEENLGRIKLFNGGRPGNLWFDGQYKDQTCEQRAKWWQGQSWHQGLKEKGNVYPGSTLEKVRDDAYVIQE
jgi:hypothetical protein